MRETAVLLPPSRLLLAAFNRYLHWYIGRHFRAMRLAKGNRFPRTSGPLIVYSNHASWWDPLTFFVMSHYLLPDARHYAPMDAQALEHYGFFRKLGIFPVEANTLRGAAQFLSVARQITSTPGSVLWLTPEGHFTDVRTRPAVFRSGLAALVARIGPCTLVPLAAEYTFWDERLPEMLLCCGQPIAADGALSHEHLETALAATQDELAALASLRDSSQFETILFGRAGISGAYDGWKRFLSVMTGRAYHDSHGSIHRS
jgi:1-acyl-sn-glycerol-3-phosphate acyltransferase